MVDVDNPSRASWRRRATVVTTTVATIATGGLGLAAAAMAASSAPAAVYVSPTGTDSVVCGSSTLPCRTIQYGINQAAAGATVNVAAGTYTEAIDIEKAVTVQGAGASSTIIDGQGKSQSNANHYGVVYVGAAGGAVTLDSVTVRNPSNGPAPESVVVQDPTATDTVTISNDTIQGNASITDQTVGQIGIAVSHDAAAVSVSKDDISGVHQGVLLDALSGASTVDSNAIHALTTQQQSTSVTAPAQGVSVVSDLGTAVTAQNVTNNTFSGYGGTGIAYAGGVDGGSCATTPCNGSITGSVTGNTFTLAADAGNLPAAALAFSAVNSGALTLSVGGNTGTVVAQTNTILQTISGAGTVSLAPTSSPDSIQTSPVQTLTVTPPTSITTTQPAAAFSEKIANPAGETLHNVRNDVKITGTSAITGSQISLRASTDGGVSYQDVVLTGTANAAGGITGHIIPASGGDLAAGTTTTLLSESVPSSAAPAGTLTTTFSLTQVATNTGNPVINTLATGAPASTTVRGNSAPVAQNQMVSTTINTPVSITLEATDADNDPLTYTHGSVQDGSLTGSGPNLTFTPDTGFTGPTSFAFTVSDGQGGSDSGSVTINVGTGATTLSEATSPATVSTGVNATLTVTVSSAGTVDGGTVTVTGTNSDNSTFGLRGAVSGGKATFTLPKLPAGNTALDITYSGTSTASAAELTKTIAVTEADTTLTTTVSPSTVTTGETATLTVAVSSNGTVDGGTVSVAGTNSDGSTFTRQGTVSSGKATFTLPKLPAGNTTFDIAYSGTPTAASAQATKTITVSVASTTLSSSVSPSTVTTADNATLTVTASSTGTVDGAEVTVFGTNSGSGFGLRQIVSGGVATFSLPNLPAGTTALDIQFEGTPTAAPREITPSIAVSRTTASFSVRTDPSPLHVKQTKKGHIVVTYSAPGADCDGARGRLYFGGELVSQGTVSGSRNTFGIYRTLSAGRHRFTLVYSGSATVAPFTGFVYITVAR